MAALIGSSPTQHEYVSLPFHKRKPQTCQCERQHSLELKDKSATVTVQPMWPFLDNAGDTKTTDTETALQKSNITD